ncbi:hypothetical protein FF100_04705 [Methylobacterium terricola]|uniref:LexA repressor DNA-binding domain-containing protein n=1 Tax=Methylobacterium terricola TaxID=2583531 RepID=A0A5C4LPW5_9HYPH|nr:hypothetical protein FF100_04705 [Methylobacterium terricola]
MSTANGSSGRYGLTPNLRVLLDYISGFIERNEGIAPSFDDMRVHLGLHSKSGVHRMVGLLEERGYIRRLQHRARAIEVIRQAHAVSLPDDVDTVLRIAADREGIPPAAYIARAVEAYLRSPQA